MSIAQCPQDEGTLFALVKVYEAIRDQQNAARAFEELKSSNPNSDLRPHPVGRVVRHSRELAVCDGRIPKGH